MANRFVKQSKLPFTNKDVEDAIKERLGDLDKLTQELDGVKTDAKSIRQRLTLQSTGEYPDSDDDDPTVDAAHKKCVDLVQDHKRLIREVPAMATELKAMRDEAEEKTATMEKILSDGSPNAINSAEVMKMKIPKDKMMIMVQAVTAYHGSLDFLRGLGSHHRQLLLSKEAEIAEYKRAQQASSDAGLEDIGDEEVIPSTYPELQPASTQERRAQELADLQAARSKADRKAKELERRVADLERALADEKQASAGAQDSLRQQLVENEDALKGKESALEQQKEQLATSEARVARLDSEAGKLREKIAELERGVVAKDDLMDELRETRSEVETLKERVEKMKPDVDDKSRLEEELVGQREQLELLKKENSSLENQLQGKETVLEACNKAKDSAQRLADECQAELDQKKGELETAVSLQKKTTESYNLSKRQEKKHRSDYHHELDMRQATHDALVAEQEKVKAKNEEIRGLQGSMESKETEVQGLKDTIESKEGSLRLVKNDLEQLTYQIRDRDDQLQSQNKSVAQLQADLADVGREKADAELDLGFIFRLSNLSIRTADVGLPQWTPLLRSLRVSDPVDITPEEGMSRQTWSILPSWPGSEASVGAGSVSSDLPCLHTSLDGLLLELYGHGMSEGDFPCNPCLRALCALSALVERQGVAKESSLVLVLEKLEARLRGLEATSGYEGMVMLGLRYLAALVRSRAPGGDVPGLSSVEDSLDGILEQADKCAGVIRHVSDGLCSSGGIETVEANHGLRLVSREGLVLVLLADPGCAGELFLLADPEERTVRAVSCHRLDSKVGVSEAGELVNSAVIKATAGQPDVELDLTAAEADWVQENL